MILGSLLNLLLENKISLDKILKFSIKEKDFLLVVEEKVLFLILNIKHISENSLCSQLYNREIFVKLLRFISIFKITFLKNL